MVERAIVKLFSISLEFKTQGVFFFNLEKQLFAMNPGQDLNYLTETRLSDIPYIIMMGV